MCSDSQRVILITGGPLYDTAATLIDPSDYVVCADSGVDFALAHGIRISEVFGDLDSITPDGRSYIESHSIPLHVFPVEKDMTDTELALRTIDESSEVLVLCPLSGRPDHVFTNVMLITLLRSEGRSISASDGLTDFIPMTGSESFTVSGLESIPVKAVSLVPLSDTVTGVSASGLYYELSDAVLHFGSSFSNSNELAPGSDSFSVSIESGYLGVFVTPKV